MIHPEAYAVEAGPEATDFVSRLLASPDRIARMSAFGKTHPDAIAFLDRREENDLAAHRAAVSHNTHFQLWGLDQEYVGSAGALLGAMADRKPGPRSRAAIVNAQRREQEAAAAARESARVDRLFLLASSDKEVEPLRQAVRPMAMSRRGAFLPSFLPRARSTSCL